MRKIVYILVSFILLALHVSAQRIATFEMRYITSDTKANGDSDFHGETEWMNLDQRIDFLNKYAAYSAEFWGNPQLSQPLLAIGVCLIGRHMGIDREKQKNRGSNGGYGPVRRKPLLPMAD